MEETGTNDEDWVQAAMANDDMVIQLLFRLRQTSAPSNKIGHFSTPAVHPLEWTVRQLRTKKSTPPRSSPTTPLSWSCATATESGGAGGSADGFEESSRHLLPKRAEASRSKARIGPGGTTTTLSKRTRKKKTLAELKEDESLLLKERRQLKRELEALQINLAKERVNNECLKRLKIETQETRVKTSTSVSLSPLNNMASNDPVSSILSSGSRIGEHFSVPQSIKVPITTCRQQQEGCNFKNAGFLIPDLNMPFEDNFACEVQAGAAS